MEPIVMGCALTLIPFQAVRAFEDSAFENISRFHWRQEELSHHECRSCLTVPVDISNCPDTGYECSKDQPLSAAVLIASEPCRCQTLSCANRGWKLAVNGSIVNKIRCEGKQWISATGLPAPSVICAKDTTSTSTETTTPPLARDCIPPPEPWRCNKAPFPLAPFSPVCYNNPGDGAYLISKCLNNEILVLAVPEASGYYLPSEGATWCDPAKRVYSSVTLGRRFEEIPQISCMECPYMSGEVTTSFMGAHDVAMYDECKVRCTNSVLMGKLTGGAFAAAVADTAYYAYNGPLAKFVFIDRQMNLFDNDFYCEKA